MEGAEKTPERAISAGRDSIRFVAMGLLAILLLGGLAVSWTIPFQEWDSYSIGTWSRYIADGSPIMSPGIDQIARQRPLFPVSQGLLWRVIGDPSMRAGRLLSFSFSILLVLVVFFIARRVTEDYSTAWIAALLAAASPLVSEHLSAATSDIPSAALFWTGVLCLLGARGGERKAWLWSLVGVCWGLAALGKVTAVPLAAGLTVTSAVQGFRQRWSWKSWTWMTIGLAVPAYGVYRYWNAVRPPLSWRYFLYEWAGPYYAGLSRSSRLSAAANPRWFGVFLTLLLLIGLVFALGRRYPRTSSLAVLGVGLLVARARWNMPASFREYGNGRLDDLVAGVPTVLAVAALALALVPLNRMRLAPVEGEFFIVAAAFFVTWIWKLSYDARFLLVVLPAVAILGGRWLMLAVRAARDARSRSLAAAAALAFASLTWEGARFMDRGFPVFSSAIGDVNRQHGLRPEAKMEAIFGPSMRFVMNVRQMIAANPSLRVISPDTRLAFHFGRNLDASYPTVSNIGGYDLLVWVNNTGIIGQYQTKYGIVGPLEALKSTGRLTELDKTPEYELYRIKRD